MHQSTIAENVKEYLENQLFTAGVSLADLAATGLIDKAGCSISVDWLSKLLAGCGRKITALQLIGLRRLFSDPVDIILGLELYENKNRNRMGGLKRIRWELGGNKPKTQKDMCIAANCSTPIIARIERASIQAIRYKWADINTDAEKIYSVLLSMETFSVDILTRLKFNLRVNIDDIMGLGEYDPDCIREIVFRGGKLKKMYFSESQLSQLSPQQRKHPEQVFSPIYVEEPPTISEAERITKEMQAEAALFERDQATMTEEQLEARNKELLARFTRKAPDAETLTAFRPVETL